MRGIASMLTAFATTLVGDIEMYGGRSRPRAYYEPLRGKRKRKRSKKTRARRARVKAARAMRRRQRMGM